MHFLKHAKAIFCTAVLMMSLSSHSTPSLQRFEASLQALKKMYQEAATEAPNNVSAFRQLLIKKDGRKYMFRIEGLVRLYRATEAETAKPLLKKIKILEDVTGDYVANVEFAAYGRKLNVSPAVQSVLDEEEQKSLKALDALLTQWFLQPKPYIDVFAVGLAQMRERSDQELIEAFRSEIRELAKTEFDLNLLDDGVHELRRQVRWLNIYAEGLGDLFYVPEDSEVPDDFRKLESFGSPQTARAVPKKFTRRLSKFLTDIGNLKDKAEPVEAVVLAYVRAGVAMNHQEAEKMLQAHMQSQGLEYPVVFEEAKQILREFNLPAVLNTWLHILQ